MSSGRINLILKKNDELSNSKHDNRKILLKYEFGENASSAMNRTNSSMLTFADIAIKKRSAIQLEEEKLNLASLEVCAIEAMARRFG